MGLGFFNKITDIWRRNKKIEETEDMRKYRLDYEECNQKKSDLEKELILVKEEQRRARIKYQSCCDHSSITKVQKVTTSSEGYNDFAARCDICAAELFNQSRAINYLNSLLDLMNKLPKAMESAKIAGCCDKDYYDSTYEEMFSLSSKLILLRKYIMDLRSDQFDGKIYANINPEDNLPLTTTNEEADY